MKNIKGIVWKSSKDNEIKMTFADKVTTDDYRILSLFFDSSIVPYEDYWSYMERVFVAVEPPRSARTRPAVAPQTLGPTTRLR